MSQNPFHSQDSLFRFDASGNLVVNFNELNNVNSNVKSRSSCFINHKFVNSQFDKIVNLLVQTNSNLYNKQCLV
jgi:hypothetical protein